MSIDKTMVKWFFLPWVIILIFAVIVIIMNSINYVKLTKYKDLSDVNQEELIILDKKRGQSEGVKEPLNMPSYIEGKKDVGFLLIHGFTASPYEMNELAQYLSGNGYGVYNARIVGHGSTPQQLSIFTYSDWYESIKYGYFALKSRYKKICIIGQSTGGLLALNTAYYNGADYVVLLSPALKIANPMFNLSPILKYFVGYLDKNYFNNDKLKYYYYNTRPVKSLDELRRLIKYTDKNIYTLDSPIIIYQSKFDDVVSIDGTKQFFNKIKTTDKKLEIINDKNIKHVLTTEENYKRKELFESIKKWVEDRDVQR